MDQTVIEYIGFVVAALILGWAVIELNRRYFRHRQKNLEPTWVKFDSTRVDEGEEFSPGEDTDDGRENAPEAGLHTRAQQNGHYSESKKIL